MAAVTISDGFYWVGAQDPDLRVFDVVMFTKFGTSYNSFVLKTPQYCVLFETAKMRHYDSFLSNLREVCDPQEIDYIVINHTEPDHAGSLARLLEIAPRATVLATAVALDFLQDICNRPLPGRAVLDDERIELDTCSLRFLSVPLLHWPDSMYTYIEERRILVTCDSFGCHYSDDAVCNDLIEGDFTAAYKYYFDMIMGPFKPNVRYALQRIEDLALDIIAPGHGPVLRQNIPHYIDLYRQWSADTRPPLGDKPLVVIPYVSAYGYTAELAEHIAAGISDEVVANIKTYDMVEANAKEVQKELFQAQAIVAGTPTINGDALPPVMKLLMGLSGVEHGGKVAGAFGSYGWSGEGPEALMSRFNLLRMKTVEPALKVRFKPSVEDRSAARRYGVKLGRRIREEWELLHTAADGMTYWRCTVCGEIFASALPPEICPVCGAGVEAFVEHRPEVVTFRQDRRMRVLIVGTGPAAIASAEALRKRNAEAEIVVYGAEKELPYYRPTLTRALGEKIGDAEFYLHSAEYYENQGIAIHLGSRVEGIDRTGKTIQVNGEALPYDKLLLATGSSCFVPPIQGSTLPGVFTLRSQKDLLAIRERLDRLQQGRVAIIGGGLLGLEAASALSQAGHSVTIFEAAPTILPRQLDAEGGSMFAQVIEQSAVQLKIGVFVDEICGEESVRSVKTSKGEQTPCDLVIISAGIVSESQLAKQAGLQVERGVVVNEHMQTSDPDIYAAGDCASFQGRVNGVWETALDQGRVAGAHMAGEPQSYQPKIMGATLYAFGTKVFSIGDLGDGQTLGAASENAPSYQHVTYSNALTGTYRRFFFAEGRLRGGILLGDTRLTNVLLNGVIKQFSIEEAGDQKLI